MMFKHLTIGLLMTVMLLAFVSCVENDTQPDTLTLGDPPPEILAMAYDFPDEIDIPIQISERKAEPLDSCEYRCPNAGSFIFQGNNDESCNCLNTTPYILVDGQVVENPSWSHVTIPVDTGFLDLNILPGTVPGTYTCYFPWNAICADEFVTVTLCNDNQSGNCENSECFNYTIYATMGTPTNPNTTSAWLCTPIDVNGCVTFNLGVAQCCFAGTDAHTFVFKIDRHFRSRS